METKQHEPGAFRLGFIGVGHMASVIISSLLESGAYAPAQLVLSDLKEENTKRFTSQGAYYADDTHELVALCDMIVLAVRPTQMEKLLVDIGQLCSGKCLVSIAAGVTTGYIKSYLPPLVHVVRVMPNMTMAQGCGATAVAGADGIPKRVFDRACSIFASGGIVEVVDEAEMNAVIGVNGSSPAFFFRTIAVMAECAQAQGIDRAAALRLAAKTMEGAARMLIESGTDPETLVAQVATTGGTTRAAMDIMDSLGFDDILRRSMLACTKRARELSGE